MANKPEPPAPWIVIGVVVTSIGVALFSTDETTLNLVGAVLAVVGGFVTQIAVVAAGVSWGMNRHEYRRSR